MDRDEILLELLLATGAFASLWVYSASMVLFFTGYELLLRVVAMMYIEPFVMMFLIH